MKLSAKDITPLKMILYAYERRWVDRL